MKAFRISPLALKRFWRSEDGVALVEFGLLLPVMLLVFAVIMEGSRAFWSYHMAVTGVRDATRFLSRTAPANACVTGAPSSITSQLDDIVKRAASNSVFPGYVTVGTVSASFVCGTGTYRVSPVSVGTVTANVTIEYPFSGIFQFFGKSLTTTQASIQDSARIYGI
ncbi:MAG: pilus assembly protein [Paracoccaceae bacterium]|nr:pilus assembly protein [Paracoccaceae bacterium]